MRRLLRIQKHRCRKPLGKTLSALGCLLAAPFTNAGCSEEAPLIRVGETDGPVSCENVSDSRNTMAGRTTVIENLIGDYLDSSPFNREPVDLGALQADPFHENMVPIHPDLYAANRTQAIDCSQFEPLNPFRSDGEFGQYSSIQKIWVSGSNRWREMREAVVADLKFVAYTVEFRTTDGLKGIDSREKDLEIMLLGELRTVTDFMPPDSEGDFATGGAVRLRSVSGEVRTIESGRRIEGGAYKAILGWTMEEGEFRLERMIFYTITSGSGSMVNNDLEVADSLPLVPEMSDWKLTYIGLDMNNLDRDALRFELLMEDKEDLRVTYEEGLERYCTINAPYLLVTSEVSGAFEAYGVGNDVYIATNGMVCADGTTYAPNSAIINSATGGFSGVLLEYSEPIEITYSPTGIEGATSLVRVMLISPADAESVWLQLDAGFDASALSNVRLLILMSELAGGLKSDRMLFGIRNDPSPLAWSMSFDDFAGGTNTYGGLAEDSIRYKPAGPLTLSIGNETEGFITERGSRFESMTQHEVVIRIAKRVAKARFLLEIEE